MTIALYSACSFQINWSCTSPKNACRYTSCKFSIKCRTAQISKSHHHRTCPSSGYRQRQSDTNISFPVNGVNNQSVDMDPLMRLGYAIGVVGMARDQDHRPRSRCPPDAEEGEHHGCRGARQSCSDGGALPRHPSTS